MTDGALYFIEADRSRLIKIGFTAGDPEERRRALATGAAEPLRLLVVVPGSIAVERRLHARFATSHSHLEWFFRTPDLASFVEGLRFLLEMQAAAPPPMPRRMTAEEHARRARERDLEALRPAPDLDSLARGADELIEAIGRDGPGALPKRRVG